MIWEVPMRHDNQIFTVFGGSFVAETHETSRPTAPKNKDRSFGPLVALLIASLLGATIPAVAISASNRLKEAEAARWQQAPSFARIPGIIGFEHAVY
jgi:hypothetical protein